jgi:hypothetical protein
MTPPGVGITSGVMDESADPSVPEEITPLGQRLFDNIFLLLIAGLVVVFALYTGWGLWEITSLPPATLP